jgi:hypothetical protein
VTGIVSIRSGIGAIVAALVAFPLIEIGLQSVWAGAILAAAATCLLAGLASVCARTGLASAHTAFGWLTVSELSLCLVIYMLLLGQMR